MFKFDIKLNHNKELLSIVREKNNLLKSRIFLKRVFHYTLASVALLSYKRKMSGFTSLTSLRILYIPSKKWRKRKHKRGD